MVRDSILCLSSKVFGRCFRMACHRKYFSILIGSSRRRRMRGEGFGGWQGFRGWFLWSATTIEGNSGGAVGFLSLLLRQLLTPLPGPIGQKSGLLVLRGSPQSGSSPSAFARIAQTQKIIPAGFAAGGFVGFRISVGTQGEEEHDVGGNLRSSASHH